METKWIWPFEVEDQIGAGAMGVVYRARFVKNNKRVALKLLPIEIAANRTLAARLQRAMEVLMVRRHANIVHCFGGTCEGQQWFYAMELVEGGTLASLLQDHGRIRWQRVVEIGLQICAALTYSHGRGVIHRDLKPGNLLLTKSGQVKLGDFGLVLLMAEVRLTEVGKTMGSLPYMSPEQIRGKPPQNQQTDLYALGCSLFEMLTARTPFNGESAGELMQQHLHMRPPRVSNFALDCPAQLADLVDELLSKEQDSRPPSAQEVARRLQDIERSVVVKPSRYDRNFLPTVAMLPATGDRRTARPTRWAAWLFGVVVALVLCWQVVAQSSRKPPEAASARLLSAALRNSDPTVREFAAQTLGELGPAAHSALPELRQSLDDANESVRLRSIWAMGQISPKDPLVQAALKRVQKQSASEDVRHAVVAALAKSDKSASGWQPDSLFIVLATLVGSAVAAGLVWRKLRAPPPPSPRRGKRHHVNSDQMLVPS
jgi:serine/threonine-protein kinase